MLHFTPRPRPLPSQAPGRVPVFHHAAPTAGTSVAPLVPLVRSLGAWLALPSPSRWLLRTIRLGYAIQFARRPPKFRGIRFTSVKAVDAPGLHAEIAVLLAKDAIEPVPPADMRSGFYSPYFIVPKKSGGLRPRTFISQSSCNTGHSCDSRSRVRHISTRSCPSGCPCRLVSSPKSQRQPLFP